MATPYVISSDLVSAYPAKSLEIAQYIDGFKADLALVQNAQTGTTYTFVAADFTKLVTLSNASPVAVTLPLESSVPWPAGTQLRLLNQGAGTVTVAGAVGVTINGTPLTLAQYKAAVITKTGTDTWTFVPFSGGSAPAVISSTTGSPTITTAGQYTYYEFTGDGTIVVGTAGTVALLVCGAGGGGGGGFFAGGGGGGGLLIAETFGLLVQTYTIKVPAGGAGGGSGGAVGTTGGVGRLDAFTALGGGAGAMYESGDNVGKTGASGGGGGSNAGAAGAALYSGAQGNDGAAGTGSFGGGGGGFSSAASGRTQGNGLASSLSGASVTYGAGGQGAVATPVGGTSGAANTGTGGEGGGTSTAGGAGGSGVVIVRVG
jgi:hypothetical protein